MVQTGGLWASLSSGPWLCRKLQKSLAEQLRREGTGVHRGLVVPMPGPEAVRDRTICTNNARSHPGSPWATPAQGSPSLRPRLSVPCLPGSMETPDLGWPCHQPHRQPAAHSDVATTLLGLVPRAGISKMALSRCYFDSLSLCQCPCREWQLSLAKGLRTGMRHSLVTSSSGPLAPEGKGRAATDCCTTDNPSLPACGPAVLFPALFPVLSPQPLLLHQLAASLAAPRAALAFPPL